MIRFVTLALSFLLQLLLLPSQVMISQLRINDEKTVTLPSVNLDSIFTDDHSWTATLSAQKTVTLLATGDVLTARSVNAKTVEKNNFNWPLEKTSSELQAADITYINLETPLINECPSKHDGMIFCGDPSHAPALKFAGVDVVNLANNHMGNYGQDGVNQTVQSLQAAGLTTAGVTNQTIPVQEVKGTSFAFLGYNEVDQQVGINLSYRDLITQQVKEAEQLADLVIVQFHWGNEYTYQPTLHQIELAQLAIDTGADLIIGNHPHWWQPISFYKGKPIMYSHGNFIFDQMWSAETREGVVGKYIFYEGKLVDIEFLPVRIEDYGQPYWLEGKEKKALLDSLKTKSFAL